MITVGARLKEEREAAGLSQSQIAKFLEECGVAGASRQSQANYEKGKQQPGALYLIAIGQLGIDVLYVLTGVRIVDAIADNAIFPREDKEMEDATLRAWERLKRKVERLKEATGWTPREGREVLSEQANERASDGFAETGTVVAMPRPPHGFLPREEVASMIIDSLHEANRSLPATKVWAIVDAAMALQRGGIDVDKSTLNNQLQLIK